MEWFEKGGTTTAPCSTRTHRAVVGGAVEAAGVGRVELEHVDRRTVRGQLRHPATAARVSEKIRSVLECASAVKRRWGEGRRTGPLKLL